MQTIIQKYIPSLKTKLKARKNKSIDFYSVTDAASSLQAAILYKSLESQSLFVILPTNFEAEAYYREMISYIDQEEVYYFPGSETIPYEWAHVPPDIKRDRVLALNRILSGTPSLFIGSVTALLQKVPIFNDVFSRTIDFVPTKDYDQENLLRDLVRLGYERRTICDHFGTFSVKGGIVDIFPSHSRDPIRLDFFGDTLEDIKAFDPLTQRSLGKIPNVTILPADEYILSESEKKEYYNIINSDDALKKPEETLLVVEELIPLVRMNTGLLSYFGKNKPVVLATNFEVIQEKAFQLEREMKTLYEKKKDVSLSCAPELLISFDEEFSILTDKKFQSIRFHRLPPPEGSEDSVILNAKPTVEFKGKIREARETIESVLSDENGSKILITSSFIQQTDRLESLFSTHGIKRLNPGTEEPKLISMSDSKDSRFLLVLSELSRGFELPDDQLIVFTENDIFGRKYKRKTRYKKAPSRAIESFLDLKEWDYVVHINHGVGRFKTIERVTADSKQRDYIKLEYAGNSSLFVPLDQISLVQRYVGGTEHPRLDSLGKNNWKKTKERVRESIEKLAEDLVRMYANRLKYRGYAFPPDTIWQEEFEADFEYEETPDQLSAIEAVKADLENTKPMDRLVCGDVGYGKTEVAIRAAFKVIMAGKQVLLMSPTTILSLQHFNTFSDRYASYPIKVGYISRFKTASEIKKSLEDFSKGELDILIGTHAVLSSRMKPKNLGLLIIDEEQKFGVNHKETIKKFKHMVDVLTLTATPIPRTLHMALTGIRDLSIISTPPKNRQTVETYVMEENEDVLIKSIRREIDRGGQVFYLYNRVESIESEAKYLTDLLPDLSVGILHGQMDDDSIEEILMDFYNRNYDILVTTTIIESGIDMPNVNTLIIKRADTFGLSQLYQIRGRVGRSDKKAYAYLFHPPGRVMTEVAEKRLNTIYEYQELGSGFKVAMRDLEIRGAGNLLGSEQSGDIIEVGFDLYVKMLDEAIARVKGEDIEVEIRTSINLSTNFFLPDDYIPDNRQKIEFYKKFEGCLSLEELEEVEVELIDRFGEPKSIAKTFLLLERIRTVASTLGFESLSEAGEEIRIKSGSEFKGDASSVVNLISKTPGLTISPSEPSILRYKHNAKNEEEKLSKLFNLLIQVQPRKKTKNVMDNDSKS